MLAVVDVEPVGIVRLAQESPIPKKSVRRSRCSIANFASNACRTLVAAGCEGRTRFTSTERERWFGGLRWAFGAAMTLAAGSLLREQLLCHLL